MNEFARDYEGGMGRGIERGRVGELFVHVPHLLIYIVPVSAFVLFYANF